MSLLGILGTLSGISALSPAISSVGNGLGNLISGGSWSQSGSEVASQAFSAEEAQKSRDFTSSQNALNRAFDAEQAQLNREFQLDILKNQYKYKVEGMRAAGLNPYLAYNEGVGSVPVGSAASYQTSGQSATASSQGYSNNNYVGNFLNGALKVLSMVTLSTNALANATLKYNAQRDYLKAIMHVKR